MTPAVDALLHDLSWTRPEALLAGFALSGVLIGAIFGNRASGFLAVAGAAVLAVAGALAMAFWPAAPVAVFAGTLVIDGFAAVSKALMGLASAVILLMMWDHFRRLNDRRFELSLMVTLSVLGLFIMASANNLMTLYLGVELQSLAAYVLAAFRRDDARSSEAGLKYFVLGALSSGVLLYGCSLVYGFAGSTAFADIAQAHQGVGMIFGLVFVICGVAFKMSAAPFHMWTPDVYEGAPTPVTALFAAAPKLAAVALMARVLYGPFGAFAHSWQSVVEAIAWLSLLVGSFAALVQTNIKRLMAYSSIANVGFVLMGLAAGETQGAPAALLYMAIYLPMTIGAFALIMLLRRNGEDSEQIADLAGLGARRPWMAALFSVLFFSLAGIPPLAGFFAKFYVFRAALDAGLWGLAISAALFTVVGAGYYLWIIKTVWFDAPQPRLDKPDRKSVV